MQKDLDEGAHGDNVHFLQIDVAEPYDLLEDKSEYDGEEWHTPSWFRDDTRDRHLNKCLRFLLRELLLATLTEDAGLPATRSGLEQFHRGEFMARPTVWAASYLNLFSLLNGQRLPYTTVVAMIGMLWPVEYPALEERLCKHNPYYPMPAIRDLVTRIAEKGLMPSQAYTEWNTLIRTTW